MCIRCAWLHRGLACAMTIALQEALELECTWKFHGGSMDEHVYAAHCMNAGFTVADKHHELLWLHCAVDRLHRKQIHCKGFQL